MTSSRQMDAWSNPAVLISSLPLRLHNNGRFWWWRQDCVTWRLAGMQRWRLNEQQLSRIILDLWSATP